MVYLCSGTHRGIQFFSFLQVPGAVGVCLTDSIFVNPAALHRAEVVAEERCVFGLTELFCTVQVKLSIVCRTAKYMLE